MPSSSHSSSTKASPQRTKLQEQRFERRQRYLRVFAAFFETCSIAAFAFVIPKWNATFRHNTGPQRGDWTDGMPIAPVSTFSPCHIEDVLTCVKAECGTYIQSLL